VTFIWKKPAARFSRTISASEENNASLGGIRRLWPKNPKFMFS
jgi:hypothetical protein